jgi:serine/threonine-protein phosphatase 6 regulatory ankyrin repeat subunit B
MHSTALTAAARNGHLDVVEALVAAGADVNGHDGMNATALSLASERGHLSVVQFLLASRASANTWGQDGTPLMLAALHGHEEIARALLAAKADVNSSGGDGETALILASEGGYPEIVKDILHVEPNLKSRKKDATDALYHVIEGNKGGLNSFKSPSLDVMQVLFGAGADPNTKEGVPERWPVGDQNTEVGDSLPPLGCTLLIRAASHGYAGAVKALLSAMASANARCYGGETALMLAARSGDLDTVRVLLDAKADVNAYSSQGPGSGHTALSDARNHQHPEVVERLRQYGAHE